MQFTGEEVASVGRMRTLPQFLILDKGGKYSDVGRMTVAKLIEWLGTQDQGKLVTVVVHTSGRGYYDQGGNAKISHFDPELHVEEGALEILLGEING